MNDQILVGRILKPQGVKGEVKIKPIIDDISRFDSFSMFFVGKDKKEMIVNKICSRFGFVYCFLEGVDSRNDAETLRNKDLFVSKMHFGKIKEDTYLIDELIGLSVVDENGETIGTIEEVDNYGSADILTITRIGRQWQIPFLKDVFGSVDFVNKTITVDRNKFDEVKL